MRIAVVAAAVGLGLVALLVRAGLTDNTPPRAGWGVIPGYALDRPDRTFDLPAGLREISALTDIDEQTAAAVQDEAGIVFFVDLRDGTVVRTLPFGEVGDYEGLTRVGDRLWVLRSDGLMCRLVERGGRLVVDHQLALRSAHRDIEGLGYDPVRKLILIAPKDPPAGDKHGRAERRVLAVNPADGRQLDDAALTTSVDRIVAAAERRGIALPTRETRNGRLRTDLKVRFSSIAVHPRTDEVYLLSAIDGALLVIDRAGELLAAHFFDATSMPKVEGITFLADGTMVIASEGVGTPPRLQVFRYRPDGGSGPGGVPSPANDGR